MHTRMDLKTRSIVHSAPYASEVLLRTSLEDTAVEAMANNVRRGRHTCKAGTNDCNFWAHKIDSWRRWCG
jgi:hypothetical protein